MPAIYHACPIHNNTHSSEQINLVAKGHQDRAYSYIYHRPELKTSNDITESKDMKPYSAVGSRQLPASHNIPYMVRGSLIVAPLKTSQAAVCSPFVILSIQSMSDPMDLSHTHMALLGDLACGAITLSLNYHIYNIVTAYPVLSQYIILQHLASSILANF